MQCNAMYHPRNKQQNEPEKEWIEQKKETGECSTLLRKLMHQEEKIHMYTDVAHENSHSCCNFENNKYLFIPRCHAIPHRSTEDVNDGDSDTNKIKNSLYSSLL